MSAFGSWIALAAVVAVAVIAVEGIRRLMAGGRLSTRWPGAGEAARRCTAPAFTFAVVIGTTTAMPYHRLGETVETPLRQALKIAAIGATTWLFLRISYALTEPAVERLMHIEGERSRRARKVRTQMLLVRRIAAAVFVVIAVGAALFTFPAVRAIGAGVLASAGVAGVVVGIAAKPALGNLFAGLQIAFSDALRLGDVVVVEGQWGRVEELTLSYVVVRVWDERRLILPVSYFTEQAFENWTRQSNRLLGTVMFYVDWSIPVEKLRSELYEALRDNPAWDRRQWSLVVTDVLPNGLIEVRALMSAADDESWWQVRCDVREHMIGFIRENYPDSLPRFRAEVTEAAPGQAPSPGAEPSIDGQKATPPRPPGL